MKLKSILVAVILAILFAGYKYVVFLKKDHARISANYENQQKENADALRLLDSSYNSLENNFITYTFKKDQELSDYFNSNNNHLNGVSKKLEKANIDLKRVTGIISTLVNARDTIVSTINMDSLAHKINTLPSFAIPFLDKTDCFEITGKFNFESGNSSIILTNRKFTDTITRVDSWSRKKHRWVFGLKTGLFGKKILHRNEFSKCIGKTKTIVIEKRK